MSQEQRSEDLVSIGRDDHPVLRTASEHHVSGFWTKAGRHGGPQAVRQAKQAGQVERHLHHFVTTTPQALNAVRILKQRERKKNNVQAKMKQN